MANPPLPHDVSRELTAMSRDDTERRVLHDALARLRDELVGPTDEVTARRHLVAMRSAAAGDVTVPTARRRRSRVAADDPSLALAKLTGRIGFTPTDEELPDRLLQAIARMSRAARGGDAARSRHEGGSGRTHPSAGNGEPGRDAGPPGQGGPSPVRPGGGPGGPALRWSHRYPAE